MATIAMLTVTVVIMIADKNMGMVRQSINNLHYLCDLVCNCAINTHFYVIKLRYPKHIGCAA